MNHQERFIECLTFGRPDRYMLWQLFGLLPGVLERWISEGMPMPDNPADPLALFGFDPQPLPIAVNTSAHPGCVPKVIEDTDEYTIARDNLGRTTKLIKSSASIPLPLDWPVSKPEDWEEIKPMFEYHPKRFADNWLDNYSSIRHAGLPVSFVMSGFYDFPRKLMGDEQLALAYFDYPDMLLDMMETYTNLILAIIDEIGSKASIDIAMLSEDMAYKGGMMISPRIFEQFLAPYYRQVTSRFKDKGIRIIAVDSDGFVGELVPLLISVGVNAMFPFEARAGNDIALIRQEHGSRFAMIGGLDKFCVTQSKEAIDKELSSKLPEMVRTGGYIASLDHRVTIETPFEDYLYYVEQAKRYLSIS